MLVKDRPVKEYEFSFIWGSKFMVAAKIGVFFTFNFF